jgi:hypothetical protein
VLLIGLQLLAWNPGAGAGRANLLQTFSVLICALRTPGRASGTDEKEGIPVALGAFAYL